MPANGKRLGAGAAVCVNVAWPGRNFILLRPMYKSSTELLSTRICTAPAIVPNRVLAAVHREDNVDMIAIIESSPLRVDEDASNVSSS